MPARLALGSPMAGAVVLEAGMLVGMRQPLCQVVVGRSEELAVLAQTLDRLTDGQGAAVIVAGEAGVKWKRAQPIVSILGDDSVSR